MLIYILKSFISVPAFHAILMEMVVEAQLNYIENYNRKSQGFQVLIARYGTEDHNINTLKRANGVFEQEQHLEPGVFGSPFRTRVRRLPLPTMPTTDSDDQNHVSINLLINNNKEMNKDIGGVETTGVNSAQSKSPINLVTSNSNGHRISQTLKQSKSVSKKTKLLRSPSKLQLPHMSLKTSRAYDGRTADLLGSKSFIETQIDNMGKYSPSKAIQRRQVGGQVLKY